MVGILFRHPFAAVDLEFHGQNVATVTHTLIDTLSSRRRVGGGGLGSSLGFAPQARARPVQRWHHTGEAGFTHRLHHQHREQIRLRRQRQAPLILGETMCTAHAWFESNPSGGALMLPPQQFMPLPPPLTSTRTYCIAQLDL